MRNKKDQFRGMQKRMTAGAAMALLLAGNGMAALPAQSALAQDRRENQMTTTQSKFYCNINALTPAERAHHKQLSEKLMAAREKIVETAKGYEFQFSPQNVSLAELAEWVATESKCCAFFDFHIDLENEGKLLCLRLTGEEGIKAFIRSEFGVH